VALVGIAAMALASCGGQAEPSAPASARVAPVASAIAAAPGGASSASQATQPIAGEAVQLSNPVVLSPSNVAGVLVTNTSNQMQSVAFQATFSQAGKAVASATGAVQGLRPGERRAAALVSPNPIPSGATASVSVTELVGGPATQLSDIAAKIHLAAGTDKGPSVDVLATNADLRPHSFNVGVALLRGGTLIGLGTAAVTQLPPNASTTASVTIIGSADKPDQTLTYVEAVTA
jgi:hypothetical protein